MIASAPAAPTAAPRRRPGRRRAIRARRRCPFPAPYFIAFPVGSPTLEGLLAQLPAPVVPAEPADLHLTAAFLGAVSESAAIAAFEHAVRLHGNALQCQTSRIVLLGPEERPWAVCLELEGEGSPLAQRLEALRDPCRAVAGVGPEGRAVLPHVTLGAIPKSADDAARSSVAAWAREHPTDGVTVEIDRIALYTHGETRGRYRVVAGG